MRPILRGMLGSSAVRIGAASALVLIIASTVVLERLESVGRSGLSALHFAGVGSGIGVSAVLVAAMRRAFSSR